MACRLCACGCVVGGREGEPRVLPLSSEAHASGINLQCARYVLLLHPHCPEAVLQTLAPSSNLGRILKTGDAEALFEDLPVSQRDCHKLRQQRLLAASVPLVFCFIASS